MKNASHNEKMLNELEYDDVKWVSGFWKIRERYCIDNTIPVLFSIMSEPSNSASFTPFYIAAGLKDGSGPGTYWSDGDCYKLIEAMTYMWARSGNDKIKEYIDSTIGIIAKAQDIDGYIHTSIQIDKLNRFTDRIYHEDYNFGHLFTAACVHKKLTGTDVFFNIAIKAADCLYREFSEEPIKASHFGWNPSHIMGLVDLYRITKNDKYLKLSRLFIDSRGTGAVDFEYVNNTGVPISGGDQNQDGVPFKDEEMAVGHGVTAAYLYSGAADIVCETGDMSLFKVLDKIWKDIQKRRLYIHGGIGSMHKGISERGHAVHEAFGLEYNLHNSTAYCETCANIANAMWNWRMLNITADAKYADNMELVVYNSGLSGQTIDGTKFRYTNPLRWYGQQQKLLSNDTFERWTTHKCFCCPPQIARTVMGMSRWAYSINNKGLWVNLYGASVLSTVLENGDKLELVQESLYPWDGKVRLRISEIPDDLFNINLRIPGWAKRAEISINRQKLQIRPVPGSYHKISRKFDPGDIIELDLHMEARLIRANAKVEEARNQVAVMRGPLVYCLEQIDLPENIRLSDVYLSPRSRYVDGYETDLLGGLGIIKTKGYVIPDGNTNNDLYFEICNQQKKEMVDITLIPYFAWNNRGIAPMSVWLPVAF